MKYKYLFTLQKIYALRKPLKILLLSKCAEKCATFVAFNRYILELFTLYINLKSQEAFLGNEKARKEIKLHYSW